MKSNYDKFPSIRVPGGQGHCVRGWNAVTNCLREAIARLGDECAVVAIECYSGVFTGEITRTLRSAFPDARILDAADAFLPPGEVDRMVSPFDGGDDPVFGKMNDLRMEDFLDAAKLHAMRREIAEVPTGLIFIVGHGASLIHSANLLVYADLARWEAQGRMRRNEISNLGMDNPGLKWSLQYKRAYFTDWRVCDRLKRDTMDRWDFVLDTNRPGDPRMADGEAVRRGLEEAAARPFRVVPFFDPGPWGGQWMKSVCDLDPRHPNYAWCFDCVPEENSLLLDFGGIQMELPAINLVFHQPMNLLGKTIFQRFGAEFPIRFDLLDTMEGGNLSFQVHPLAEYIRERFGMPYTQDESYYMLDAAEDAVVYLGVREGIDPAAMAADLQAARHAGKPFDDTRFVNRFPARKHDHFLIPAGTCHCSGRNSLVLEISATPYIFTFKMWDWGRLGLDGKPRPIHLEHGIANIQWDRDTTWCREQLVNAIEPLASGDGWREERTGLHASQFIETRRHWFTRTVTHHTEGNLNVLNLVEGREAIIESPSGAFEPFVVHYAETFIIPAAVGAYTIRPHGEAVGTECATLKAFVRT